MVFKWYNNVMKRIVRYCCLILIVCFLINNQEAHAYINPSSGSYIFQTLIGGILSIFCLVKKLFNGFLNLFRKAPGKNNNE